MTLVDRIIDYETNNLTDEQTLDLFADLIRTGMAWSLQGHYGRIASSLIEQGIISKDGEEINLTNII